MEKLYDLNLKSCILDIVSSNTNTDKTKSTIPSSFVIPQHLLENVTSIVKSNQFDQSDQSNKSKLINPNIPLIYNKAPNGLWYNWATSVGEGLVAISYSAGTTYILENSQPLVKPKILVYHKEQINSKAPLEPLYSIDIEEEGIRSMLMVDDDCGNPYLLIGTFTYPKTNQLNPVKPTCKLLKWILSTNIVQTLYLVENSNSIRSILRYNSIFNSKCKKLDYFIFSTQADSELIPSQTKIYWIKKCYIDTNINPNFKFKYLSIDGVDIFGSVWDLFLDSNTLYISVPLKSDDPSKISGFNIRGRMFYCDVIKLFDKHTDKLNVRSIVGNSTYPAGFDINSVSALQIQTNRHSEKVYMYSLSDTLYQALGTQLREHLKMNINDLTTVLEFLIFVRELINGLDLDGTRIFSFNKKDLFSDDPVQITTLVGTPVYNSINKSTTTNGYNNFANIYAWCSTANCDDFYFGTLDIRSQIYVAIVYILAEIFSVPDLIPILLGLPEFLIILITEIIFDPGFILDSDFNFQDKLLYFDIIKINEKTGFINKITSDGFNPIDGLTPVGDDGVRNLDVVTNCSGSYLLIGTTCYQPSNSAKVYTLKIK